MRLKEELILKTIVMHIYLGLFKAFASLID